jgi:hypothetical protein
MLHLFIYLYPHTITLDKMCLREVKGYRSCKHASPPGKILAPCAHRKAVEYFESIGAPTGTASQKLKYTAIVANCKGKLKEVRVWQDGLCPDCEIKVTIEGIENDFEALGVGDVARSA